MSKPRRVSKPSKATCLDMESKISRNRRVSFFYGVIAFEDIERLRCVGGGVGVVAIDRTIYELSACELYECEGKE